MNARRDRRRHQEGRLPVANWGRRGREGREEDGVAWPESQGLGVGRVTSLSTWARTPAGIRQRVGDTLGRARETGGRRPGLDMGTVSVGSGDGQTPKGSFLKDECKLISG